MQASLVQYMQVYSSSSQQVVCSRIQQLVLLPAALRLRALLQSYLQRHQQQQQRSAMLLFIAVMRPQRES
jgi:hypothetical protein